MILPEIKSDDDDNVWSYEYVTVKQDNRMATITVRSSYSKSREKCTHVVIENVPRTRRCIDSIAF